MPNNKFPEHDYLSKEFYGHFWGNFKIFFINSLKQSKIDGHLPISQRQVIIKLLLKKKKIGGKVSYLMVTQKYYLNHL